MKSKISVLLALIVALAITVTAFADSAHLYSDVNQDISVYGPLLTYTPLNYDSNLIDQSAWGSSEPAVLAWNHASWPLLTPAWISNTAGVEGGISGDTWRWFTTAVFLCDGAINISGTIRANADNAEEVFVKGVLLGSDGTVQGPFIDGKEWETVKSYPFGPAQVQGALQDGYLPIDFIVRNGPGSNPTGLIFEAMIDYTCPSAPQETQHIWDVSAGDVLVYGPIYQYAPPHDPSWNLKPVGAKRYKYPDWDPLGPASNAKWISNNEFVDPIDKDSWRRFTRSVCFQPDDPNANVSGTIRVSADNAKEVYVDGVLVGSDGDMTGVSYDDHQEWARFRVYNYSTAPRPVFGEEYYSLTFDFIVRNGPGVWKVGEVPTPTKNPTGLIFDATIDNAKIVPIEYCAQITTVTLRLLKVVRNDNGGTATTADFTLTADGTGTNDISVTSPVDKPVYVPDTFILSETGPAGYTAGPWICDNGTLNGNSLTLGPDDKHTTCTITNYDIPTPRLHLRKEVINDNGGTATTADFMLKADGTGSNDLSGTSPVNSGIGLPPDTWVLSETGPAGYTASVWRCEGGTQNGSSITLTDKQEATCTIINDDIPPKLHLRKVVVNNNGGTATVSDFTLTADGTGANDLSGTSPVDSDDTLKADTFLLSESGPAGYSASAWSCVGDGTLNGNKITLGLGQEATCTITNSIISTLIVKKEVINDNGGTKVAKDFSFQVNGGSAIPFEADGQNDLIVDPGTYNLTEPAVSGYTTTYENCTNVVIPLGGSATCTIINDDQPGTIIIKKITDPANIGSFSFDTTGTGYASFSLAGGQQDSQTLSAGTYSVKELVPLGWTLTRLDCTVTGLAGSTGRGDLNTQTAAIDLRNGDTVTCVFENTGGQNITRTQGFWSTHPQLANTAWFGGQALGHILPGVDRVVGIGDHMLCGRPIDTLGKLMGGFLSDISKTSLGTQRSPLDHARMQLLQQLLAAELNASAFGTTPGYGSFADWESAYCGTDVSAIQAAQQQAEAFNLSGDGAVFDPGGPADRKTARAIATLTWWDILP